MAFEDMTFEAILRRCLGRVPDALDKREGSVIYDALAPAAAELAQFYITLSGQMDRAFPDTAGGVDLTNKARERSVFRLPATYAVRRGVFTRPSGAPMDVPVGARFSGGEVNYAVTERLEAGAFRLVAETPGEAGNQYSGVLFPIDFIDGLGSATLTDVLIYGEDEETDDALRARYQVTLHETRFGGNVADYIDRVERIPGVGQCKVYPTWNGGGTVRLVITSAAGDVPTPELTAEVQEIVDPPGFQGAGKGFAPIGHFVTVAAVSGEPVNLSFRLTFDSGYTWNSLREEIIAALQGYLEECVAEWADTEQIVVRVARVESAALSVRGVLDIAGTTINGAATNLTLEAEEIPVLGTVTNL